MKCHIGQNVRVCANRQQLAGVFIEGARATALLKGIVLEVVSIDTTLPKVRVYTIENNNRDTEWWFWQDMLQPLNLHVLGRRRGVR